MAKFVDIKSVIIYTLKLRSIYIFSMHACIVSPPIHSKCFFKSSRSKIRSQLLMSSSLNGEGGDQFSQPIFIPAFSQRLSQLSLSTSDRDKYQQLRTVCQASKSDNNTRLELTINSTRTLLLYHEVSAHPLRRYDKLSMKSCSRTGAGTISKNIIPDSLKSSRNLRTSSSDKP